VGRRGLSACEFVALKVGRLDLLRGTVRLPRSVADELGAYLAGRTAREDLIFTAPLGGPLRESKFVPGRFKPGIRAANEMIAKLDKHGRPDPLPEGLRLHDLRHTAASQVSGHARGVPEEGLEPSCPCGPNAFKARLSADSSTPARGGWVHRLSVTHVSRGYDMTGRLGDCAAC
jgi:integrase